MSTSTSPTSASPLRRILITGTSSGLGEALAQKFLESGAVVVGIARRSASAALMGHRSYTHISLDLAVPGNASQGVAQLPAGFSPDILILNAGQLGEIRTLAQTPTDELKSLCEVNLWSVQDLLVALIAGDKAPSQVVFISSGAAVRGRKGWGGYAISKAAGNMLLQVWADECPQTHFISLAPGLVDTPMQDLLSGPDRVHADFPSHASLLQARSQGLVRPAAEIAAAMVQLLPRLGKCQSGAFVDLRKLPLELA